MQFFKQFFAPGGNTLTPADVQNRLDEQQRPFLLDVRQPDEYRGGHIVGATLIPLDQLSGRLGELPRDRDIICVCRSGSRSSSATRQLTAAGFAAFNMSGGMLAWSRAGLPVKKGGSR